MKKSQNNFTSPEQSKRLLELGVPADSADCYMKLNGIDIMLWNQPNRYTMSLSRFISRAKEYAGSEVYIPCWSVGQLIKIILNTLINNGIYNAGIFIQKETFNIDYFIDILDEDIECFDFSKLED